MVGIPGVVVSFDAMRCEISLVSSGLSFSVTHVHIAIMSQQLFTTDLKRLETFSHGGGNKITRALRFHERLKLHPHGILETW